MKTAKDPYTGETFIKRRNNQLYANRQNQIQHNNQKAQEKRKATANINRILNTNRDILKRLLGNQIEVVKSQDFLLGAGFHFGCNTHTIKKDGKKWSCVFDYAYLLLEDKQFKIIHLNG